jgi:hypothetical protein
VREKCRVRIVSRCALLGVLLLAACSGQQAAAPSPTPSPLRNPSSVALYPRSTVIAVRPLRGGYEVIATSDAPFGKLAAWARHFGAHGTAQTRGYGFEYGAFERGRGKDPHDVLVVVMDPKMVDRQLGSVVGMIANYRSLPAFMRGPIDQQVKQRLGITLSEAMDPAQPIGATFGALNEFEQRNSRGIVIIDTARR